MGCDYVRRVLRWLSGSGPTSIVATAVCGLLLVAPAGCRRREPSKPAIALHALVSGCARVRTGPTCELNAARTVRVWLDVPAAELESIDLNGVVVATSSLRPVGGGVSLSATVPAGAATLVVRARTRLGEGAHSVALIEPAPKSWFDEATALRRAGKLDEALTLARAAESRTPDDRVRALGLIARIAMARDRSAEAEAAFRESIALATSLGIVSSAAEDSFAFVYLLNERLRRAADARAVLDAVQPLLTDYPEGVAKSAYYRALIARWTGDFRETIATLREAIALCERVGVALDARFAREALAMQLVQLGRHAEARALLEEILRDEAGVVSPCERLITLHNLAYSEMLATTTARSLPPEVLNGAIRRFEEAASVDCKDAYRKAGVLVDLALALTRAGRVEGARARLAEARALMPDPKPALAASVLEAEAAVAMASGDPRAALDAFERLARLGESAVFRYSEWSAAVGRARALEALGRLRAAADAYALAETLHDDVSVMVPLGEGRGTFLADREASARARVDVLVRLGDAAGALAAARDSQRRVVGSLASARQLEALSGAERARLEEAMARYRRERATLDDLAAADVELPTRALQSAREERAAAHARLRAALDGALAALHGKRRASRPSMPVVPAGTLVLAFHPIEGESWVGLAAFGDRVRAARLGELPANAAPEVLAGQLLGPFDDVLAKATRVRFLPYGAAGRIDLHALPWRGQPLVATRTVEFAVGVDAPPDVAHDGAGAVVIGDPLGDLTAAREDGVHVAALLDAGRRAPVTRLLGNAATHEELRRTLAGSRMLFFAGHGAHAGSEGLESALLLARGARVTAGDVLALPRVPPEIVLAACEAGRAASTAPSPGLGVAQAFLVAGARSVIAPTRPVVDGDASVLTRAVIAALPPGGEWESAVALRQGQLESRQARPASDWAAFRAFVP